ncbi:MAG: hypothetical protein WCI18_00525 [Pseudomonadota bacterium]
MLELLSAHNLSYEYMSFGIGSIASAWGAQSLAEKCRGKHVLILGSAGCFYPFQSPYLIKTKTIFWKPRCVSEKLSELIEGQELPWASDSKSLLSFSLPSADVYTTPGISVASSDMVDSKVVENLEMYSLLPIYLASKTFDAFLVITNSVGPDGRTLWKDHFKSGAQLTAQTLLPHLIASL